MTSGHADDLADGGGGRCAARATRPARAITAARAVRAARAAWAARAITAARAARAAAITQAAAITRAAATTPAARAAATARAARVITAARAARAAATTQAAATARAARVITAARAAATAWAARVVMAGLAVLLLGVACVACAGGGGGGGEAAESRGRLRPGAEQPPGDDVEAVEPLLVDLLERNDEVVNEVLADPGVARDEDDPLIRDYMDLYSPDSVMPAQVVEAWLADADAGRSTHPVDAGHPAVATRIDGEIQAISDDEVRFPTCSEQRYASYEGDGVLVEMIPYREQPGEATAVRVDGLWLLLQLDSFEGQAACHAPEGTEDPS